MNTPHSLRREDADLPAADQAIVETARTFARDQVGPGAAAWEQDRRMPIETLRAAAAAGLCGLFVPRDLGGQGAGRRAVARVLEELSGECMAFAFSLVVHNNLAGNIAKNGNDDQKARYLPPMLTGERVGAFMLTEPGAGSDAAGITAQARRDGDGWIVDGEKAWVSNGTTADTLSVYAQTDVDAGWRGIACLLVDGDAPGVERLPAYSLLGAHALGTNGFRFAGCRVDDGAVLLGPGDGFKAAMAGINLARALLAACCCGMLGSSLRAAVDYAADRRAFGKSTLEFQGLEWKLADVATDLEAARRLTVHALDVMDAGSDGVVEAAHAKKFASRAAFAGIAECMQAMGAAGLHQDHALARHLACAKAAQYMDGATEIQNVVLGRHLQSRYGTAGQADA